MVNKISGVRSIELKSILLVLVFLIVLFISVEQSKADSKQIDVKKVFYELGFSKPTKGTNIKYMPKFSLMDIDDEKVSSGKYNGKIVFLIFWATWCPYCTKELPTLESLYNANKDNKKLEIVTVSINQDSFSIPLHVEANEFTFQVLLDPTMKVYRMFRPKKLRTPLTYLIAGDGKIIGEIAGGAHDWSTEKSLSFFRKISQEGTDILN